MRPRILAEGVLYNQHNVGEEKHTQEVKLEVIAFILSLSAA